MDNSQNHRNDNYRPNNPGTVPRKAYQTGSHNTNIRRSGNAPRHTAVPDTAPQTQKMPPRTSGITQQQKKGSDFKGKPTTKRRNFVLFFVFILLITAVIIISVVQSHNDIGKATYSPEKKNEVKLNSETSAADSVKTAASGYAEYTDNTAKLDIESDFGILIDLDSNTVIASKKGDERIYPASMTKIMTLIVAAENIENPDDTFTFTAEMLDPLYAQNASEAGFAPGEAVKIKDMLYGCVLPSGADATVGLANYIAGGEQEFAKLMNDKVKELGLKNTHFVTVSGLHDKDHYSTCHEMAIILKYAISNPLMREILSTYRYTTSPTKQHPDGIRLTSNLYSRMAGDEAGKIFVQGGKTGYTIEARNCLATFAAECSEELSPVTKPEYILVTASASGEYTPVFDAIKVYKGLSEK